MRKLGLDMKKRYIKKEWVEIAIIIIIIVSLIYLTYERNKVWRDDISLWEDVVEKASDNPRAHNNLGRAYGDQGRGFEAIEEFKKAVRILPNYALAYLNMAIAYSKLKTTPEAEFYYKKAIEFYPDFPEAHYNYGIFLYSIQRYEDARQYLNRYIKLSPKGFFVPLVYKILSDMDRKNMGNKTTHLVNALLISVVVFIAYSGSFNSPFHFDDYSSIISNYHIKNMRNIQVFLL